MLSFPVVARTLAIDSLCSAHLYTHNKSLFSSKIPARHYCFSKDLLLERTANRSDIGPVYHFASCPSAFTCTRISATLPVKSPKTHVLAGTSEQPNRSSRKFTWWRNPSRAVPPPNLVPLPQPQPRVSTPKRKKDILQKQRFLPRESFSAAVRERLLRS